MSATHPGAMNQNDIPGQDWLERPVYCSCARANSRLPVCRNSVTKAPVSSPDLVAASISAASKIEVATSALHCRQYFSFLPGSGYNSHSRPQELHWISERSALLPFGPHNIDVPPSARTTAQPFAAVLVCELISKSSNAVNDIVPLDRRTCIRHK